MSNQYVRVSSFYAPETINRRAAETRAENILKMGKSADLVHAESLLKPFQ